MQVGRIFDILAAIVAVAMTTVIVTGKNTAQVIQAFGSSFAMSLKAAMGNG